MKKVIIKLILIIIIILLAFIIWKNYNIKQKQVPVLVYHNIVQNEELKSRDTDTLTIQEFEEQIKYLKDNGYVSISLDELYDWKKEKIEIPEKSVVITFDDGYYSFKYLVQPVLQKYNFKAACFLIGNMTMPTTNEYKEEEYGTIGLDEVANSNKNIIYGSHTFDLHAYSETGSPIVKNKTYSEIKEDIKKFKEEKFDAKYLAYPYYTYTKDFVKALEDENYKLAFAGESEMVTKNENNYKIPRISGVRPIEEFKRIFETDQYRNRYGNGLIRKIFVTIERKIK